MYIKLRNIPCFEISKSYLTVQKFTANLLNGSLTYDLVVSRFLMTVEYNFQIVGTLFDVDTANKWYDYDPERQRNNSKSSTHCYQTQKNRGFYPHRCGDTF